jgi:hypothetical protein
VVAAATFMQRWRAEPEPSSPSPAVVETTLPARTGSADSDTVTDAPDTPDVSAALNPTDTQELAQAVAARLSGDLEESRRVLLEITARTPENEGVSELLKTVEAELWAQDTLPLRFRASHNHRIGSCDGVLSFEKDAITYRSSDHGLWRWSFDELREMNRKNRHELELVTGEKDTLRLGGGKNYDFRLKGKGLDAEDWARLERLARGG